jgi:hypothetical protein
LRNSVALTDAACRRNPALFASDSADEIELAQSICRHQCRCFSRCSEWAATIAPNDVSGTLAGVHRKYDSTMPARLRKSCADDQDSELACG